MSSTDETKTSRVGVNLPKRGRAGRCGFTLMEVLVALLILSVGLLGVATTFLLSVRTASEAGSLDGAVAIAESELELASASPERIESAAGRGRYSWTITLEDVGNDLRRISIIVGWQERGETRSYRLARLLLEPESES